MYEGKQGEGSMNESQQAEGRMYESQQGEVSMMPSVSDFETRRTYLKQLR